MKNNLDKIINSIKDKILLYFDILINHSAFFLISIYNILSLVYLILLNFITKN